MIQHRPYFAFTNDTPYLALTGELWIVFRVIFKEIWPQCIKRAVYLTSNIIVAADDYSKNGYEAYVAKIDVTCFGAPRLIMELH